jgi:hypothetical protein
MLQFLRLLFAGWVNRKQVEVVEYLKDENRLLREQLDGRRLRFTDSAETAGGAGWGAGAKSAQRCDGPVGAGYDLALAPAAHRRQCSSPSFLALGGLGRYPDGGGSVARRRRSRRFWPFADCSFSASLPSACSGAMSATSALASIGISQPSIPDGRFPSTRA